MQSAIIEPMTTRNLKLYTKKGLSLIIFVEFASFNQPNNRVDRNFHTYNKIQITTKGLVELVIVVIIGSLIIIIIG